MAHLRFLGLDGKEVKSEILEKSKWSLETIDNTYVDELLQTEKI